MRHILVLGLCASLLAGCNLTEIFTLASKSNVEQASSDLLERSDRIKKKTTMMAEKRKVASRVVQLKPPGKDTNTAIYAFGNNFSTDKKSVIEVEAILTDPQGKTYEVWAGKEGEQWPMHLGRLTFNHIDDYSFSYESEKDLTEYDTISISLQKSDQIATPSNILVTGRFPEQK